MMYERKCLVCGNEFTTSRKGKVYCCRSCMLRNMYENGTKGGCYDEDLEWKLVNGKWQCPYQKGVGCLTRYCDTCGWNPKVAEARTRAFMEKRYGY